MSAGCVHVKGSVALAGGFMLGSLAFGPGWEYALGSLAGIILTPDLDVDNGYHFNKFIRKRIGLWAEKAWDAFWYSYRVSLKHGGPLSHFPVIGTLGRLAYLFFMLIVMPYGVIEIIAPGAWDVWDELRWWVVLSAEHYKIILGLMGSDFIHFGLDILTTEHAKRKKLEIFGMPLASSQC